jgi:hypothetical protein
MYYICVCMRFSALSESLGNLYTLWWHNFNENNEMVIKFETQKAILCAHTLIVLR